MYPRREARLPEAFEFGGDTLAAMTRKPRSRPSPGLNRIVGEVRSHHTTGMSCACAIVEYRSRDENLSAPGPFLPDVRTGPERPGGCARPHVRPSRRLARR